MAPHSSTLAWKIPWTEEPGRLQSMGSLRVRHDWVTSLSLFTFMHWRRKWQPAPVFLPGESQGRGAWWAAISGVAQSRTQLKRLSSSSSSSTILNSNNKSRYLCLFPDLPLSYYFSVKFNFSCEFFRWVLWDWSSYLQTIFILLIVFLSQKDVSIAFSASKEILKFFTFTLSHIRLFVIPWTVACQAPLSIGFFRQEYWTGLHFLFQGIFLTQDRTQLCCISFIAGGSFTSEPLGETIMWPLPFIP